MNKPVRLSSKHNKFLFCSDLHVQHNPSWKDTPPLWKSRGFKDIAEHDSWMRTEWHNRVDSDTIVFNLGDPMFTDPHGEYFRQLTNWPGTTYLINGNHWSGQKQIYEEGLGSAFGGAWVNGVGPSSPTRLYPVKVNNMVFAGDQFHIVIDGQSVYMQHYAPYIWPEIGDGGFALCGHSHGRCEEINVENKIFGKILDVGVDNAIAYNKTPFFTWDEIKRIMSHKPIRKSDHH